MDPRQYRIFAGFKSRKITLRLHERVAMDLQATKIQNECREESNESCPLEESQKLRKLKVSSSYRSH